MVYNATPSDTYGKQAYKNQKREANLKTVTDNQGTIGTDISVSTYIYQKVGDKNVLIDKSLHTALTADKGEKLAYGARINKDNLAESTSYAVETVKSNLVSGVQTLSTKSIDPCTINLQGAANIVCEAKYEKVYPTTVEGVIAYKTVADNTNVVTDDGVAVLYTADKKKIVAASNWTMRGEQVVYSLRDGIDGNFGKGSYVLVIRGKGITTQAQTIEIEKDNTVVENNFVDLLFGGNAKISSMIKTANNKFFIGWFFIIAFKSCDCQSDIDKNTIICYIHIYDTYMRICGGVM